MLKTLDFSEFKQPVSRVTSRGAEKASFGIMARACSLPIFQHSKGFARNRSESSNTSANGPTGAGFLRALLKGDPFLVFQASDPIFKGLVRSARGAR
ncbi:MAG: hypothetical protein NXI21_15915 [Alphaproteobacteria bacterium]|nr:hypothetical protein [Alphaproteobacteria bacterium]